MSAKSIVMLFFTIGSFAGSYLPALFGVDVFSFTSIGFGALGGLIGIYIGYKFSEGF